VVPSGGFLKELVGRLEPKRPEARRVNQIDLTSPYGLLVTNYHTLVKRPEIEGHIFTVEIKPKCGKYERIPSKILEKVQASHVLIQDNPTIYYNLINSKVSDFDVKQVQKLMKGDEKYLTNYSPLELFSGDRKQMLESLRCLRACPQCNLKVHRDGKPWTVLSDDCLEVVVDILLQTKVLETVFAIQCVTAKTIEEVFQVHFKACCQLPEDKSKEIIASVMPHCLESSTTWRPANVAEEHWHEVLKFLFSMSARDVSVMVTFSGLKAKQETAVKLGHNESVVQARGRNYLAKVGIIDCDLKLIKKMEFYYKDKLKCLSDYVDFYSS
jgi:hypothetical protein